MSITAELLARGAITVAAAAAVFAIVIAIADIAARTPRPTRDRR